MESNIKSATISAGVSEAARAAKQANCDWGYLQRPNGERVRSATEDEARRHAEAVAKHLDLSATIDVDGVGPVTVEQP